jgi:hypothetical protein
MKVKIGKVRDRDRFCVLSDFNVTGVKEGDTITFEMPGFCSGDYTYKVMSHPKLGLVLGDNCPPLIFEGCRDYKIISKV